MRTFIAGDSLSVIDFKKILLQEWECAIKKRYRLGSFVGVDMMPVWGSCVPVAIVEKFGNDFKRTGLEIIVCSTFPFEMRRIFIKCDSDNKIGLSELKEVRLADFDSLSRSISEFAIKHGILKEVLSPTKEREVLFLPSIGC